MLLRMGCMQRPWYLQLQADLPVDCKISVTLCSAERATYIIENWAAK